MNVYIQQSININALRVGGITNSSVLQIGSAGLIKPSAHLYNTGGFTGPAPAALKPYEKPVPIAAHAFGTPPPTLIEQPSVPLQAPVRLTGKDP